MNKQIAATGFILGSFFFQPLAKAATFDRLYVFGDSLSDIGNVSNVTTAANNLLPSIPITPDPNSYYQGHFSNGPNWIDFLAPQLGLTTPITPSTELVSGGLLTFSLPTPKINFNYDGATTNNSVDFAFGGAKTGKDNYDPNLPVGLRTEIDSYTKDLNAAHQSADPNALYVVWAGTNDYLKGQSNSSTPINNLITAVKALADKGARNFFVPNLFDLGNSPVGLAKGATGSANLTKAIDKYNSALTTALNSLSNKYKGIKITSLDVNSIFKDISLNKEEYGIANVTDSCLTATSVCANPDQYLFWDQIHPTTKAHEILAKAALERLDEAYPTLNSQGEASNPPNRVPEPSSVVSLLAFGALGIGLKLKRKKKKANPVKNSKFVPPKNLE